MKLSHTKGVLLMMLGVAMIMSAIALWQQTVATFGWSPEATFAATLAPVFAIVVGIALWHDWRKSKRSPEAADHKRDRVEGEVA